MKGDASDRSMTSGFAFNKFLRFHDIQRINPRKNLAGFDPMPIDVNLQTIAQSGAPSLEEGRLHPRHQLRLATTAHSESGQATHATILNLSADGFLLRCDADIEVDEQVFVDLPGMESAIATVVWADADLLGCQFAVPLGTDTIGRARLRSEHLVEPEAGSVSTEKQLAERLIELREERGWSRAELAHIGGFSRPSIWAWETGRGKPSSKSMAKLAEVFGKSLSGAGAGDAGSGSWSREEAHLKGSSGVTELCRSLRTAVADALDIENTKLEIHIKLEA